MHSRFTPTCFSKSLPSSVGRSYLISDSSNVYIVDVYGLRSVQCGQLLRDVTKSVRRCIKTFPDYFHRPQTDGIVRYAWEQGTSALSVPSGVAVWTLVVAQHECLSPHVLSHLRFQHGHETGAASQHQILRQTWQIWSGDFWNVTTCVWKRDHVSCDVFWVARVLQERQNVTRIRREVRANFHELNP
jgi:hypothetical protein